MFSHVTLLLLAALPALAGVARGEVVVSAGEAAGAGPAFAAQQPTTVVAPLGHDATLDCTVRRLRDKSVSWVRSRDLQILSHAGVVFTADARVAARSAAAGADTRHSLHIERLRASDAGRYECQVNTEPKMSLFFNLTVVDEPVPAVVVRAVDDSEVFGAEGGAATLACEARYEPPPRDLPLPPLDVRWLRRDAPINLQSSRGGVSLDTERWAARALSRLTLAELTRDDAGDYVCAAAGRVAALTLRVLPRLELSAEAMQRDEGAASGAERGAARLSAAVAAALAALLARRDRR
ncbi:opioid-binding protein/cell adhesion molecule-like isoform X2 [Anticarsia gemmatalis]|uniref:opioid-binding protein/cell adhesion molecule-like isoform X2 n=1 Tax=Anticarsia gemmatalis TaxID=129554 RepID=UPI003F771C04